MKFNEFIYELLKNKGLSKEKILERFERRIDQVSKQLKEHKKEQNKNKVNCTQFVRQLLSKGLSKEKILEKVLKYQKSWSLWRIEQLHNKIKEEYNSNHIKKRNNNVVKKCQYPNCGKEYVGHPITKFCEFHRNTKNRVKKVVKEIKKENRIIKHNYDMKVKTFKCGLRGCKNKYKIELIPNQFIYPKYCSEHTNEFKREMFLKGKNGG